MPFVINKDTLPRLHDRETFVASFKEYVTDVLIESAQLFPIFSDPRIIEAHGAWLTDIERVEKHEPNLSEGMDHFKQCAHMAFWIRRMSPLIDASEAGGLYSGDPPPITDDMQAFRELLFAYSNEYLAFDFGYQICRFYEINLTDASPRAKELVLTEDYLRTACHFLKYKTVSPHALFLAYKSLFMF